MYRKNFGAKNYAKGYEDLYDFFCKSGEFEHRQRSVYCSNTRMTNQEVLITIIELTKKCPWLKMCLRRMDITNVGDLHEVTDIISKNVKMQD